MVAPAVRPRGVRILRRALVAASGALLLLPAAAAAHLTGAHADGHGVSAKVRTVVGPGAVAADQGLYRVAPSVGEPVFTHGPDTRAALATREAPPATDGTGFSAGAVERRPACATDFYQRVIYVNPLGFPNRLAEATARIRGVVARMNAVLYSESLASGGGGAEMKFLCDDSGQVRVDSLTAGSLSFEGAVTAARAAGLSSDRANLLIFVDGTLGGSCGISSYETDASLSIDNRSNAGGGFALVYEPCWETEAAMHESAHMMGAVQPPAPHSTGTGGHCNEGTDVMCYSPDGGDRNQGAMIDSCPGALRFDCGFDDYFDAAPEPGEYLDSHWNVGSPLNRFIAFGGPAPAPPATPHEKLGNGRKRGTSGEPGDWRHFRFRVPPRARSARVKLVAGDGADLVLYARRRTAPTRGRYDCRAALRSGRATCRVDDPEPGRWHASVLTRGGPVGVGFQIRAQVDRAPGRRD